MDVKAFLSVDVYILMDPLNVTMKDSGCLWIDSHLLRISYYIIWTSKQNILV